MRFSDQSRPSGLAVVSRSHGAAAADFDRDGWPDLAVSTHGAAQLLRNAQGVFQDLSASVGFVPEDTHGISWIDVDHDGWPDLLLSVGADRGFGRGDKQIYLNRGGKSWEVPADAPDVLRDPMGRGRCFCAADLDRDGGLDVLVMNAYQEGRPSRMARWAGGGRYSEGTEQVGLSRVQAECATVVALDPGGTPLLIAYGAGAHSGYAFRLGPSGALADVTRDVGLSEAGPTVYSVVPGDYDGDGDFDLYFIHGIEVPPTVTLLEGGVGFRLVARQRGDVPRFRFRFSGDLKADVLVGFNRLTASVFLGATGAHPATVPWTAGRGDPLLDGAPAIDPDGPLGLYLWRSAPDEYTVAVVGDGQRVRGVAGTFKSAGRGFEIVEAPGPAEIGRRTPNRLLENVEGRFVDVTARAGVGDNRSGRDGVFFDADNDGDLDLFVVNGGMAFYQQPDVLYLNRGDGIFVDVTAAAGVSGPRWGRGATVTQLDYDRDGLVDLFVTNGDGPPPGEAGPYSLWRNETRPSGHWVEVELEGGTDNPTAMGATVIAHFGGRRLALQRTSSTGRFSTSLLPLHFGIGQETEVELEVRWPSGQSSRDVARHGERLRLRQPPAAGRRP